MARYSPVASPPYNRWRSGRDGDGAFYENKKGPDGL
jgi:hypothetical protein